ncbi:AAA family ATPase [Bacillus velezensis]|uniref:AAA family ATPase n=1 Tax=Bacillus velezensis TaxID=492670 RepID=UPI00191981B1|nr:AAA family ATPase [Bacillus velezensis]UQX44877.1 AAA family ATPase [Bacillus velezensis]
MNIIRLRVFNLYGKNYDVKFHKKLTILYGLNGSGKTTVLDIIFNILNGNIKRLAKYKFSKLIFEFEKNGKAKTLNIVDFDGVMEVWLDDDFKFQFIYSETYSILKQDVDNRFNIQYNDMLNESSEEEFKEKMEPMSDLIYVPLNRRVKGKLHGLVRYENSLVRKKILYKNEINNGSNQKNIEDSIQIANRHFELHKQRIVRTENQINTKLRNRMVANFSRPVETNLLEADELNFDDLEEKLKIIFKNEYGFNQNINKLIAKYHKTRNSYEKIGDYIMIKDNKSFIDHTSAYVQLSKLSEIEVIATKEKNRIDLLKKNLEHVLDSINSLLKDTRKHIKFDEYENKLVFSNWDNKEELDLSLLSSGEKQIVIFFVFSLTSHYRSKDKLLLIDEPELSLHVEWQSKLLKLLMLNNTSSQIIIASHSPDVIGDYYELCTEVRGTLS